MNCNAAADLEHQITRERELAESAMRQASEQRNPRERRRLQDVARGHYSMMAGLISKRTDAPR